MYVDRTRSKRGKPIKEESSRPEAVAEWLVYHRRDQEDGGSSARRHCWGFSVTAEQSVITHMLSYRSPTNPNSSKLAPLETLTVL